MVTFNVATVTEISSSRGKCANKTHLLQCDMSFLVLFSWSIKYLIEASYSLSHAILCCWFAVVKLLKILQRVLEGELKFFFMEEPSQTVVLGPQPGEAGAGWVFLQLCDFLGWC